MDDFAVFFVCLIISLHQAVLLSAYGRLYLQLGNIAAAESYFSQAAETRGGTGEDAEGLLDAAFLAVGQGQFDTALDRFKTALGLVGGPQVDLQ